MLSELLSVLLVTFMNRVRGGLFGDKIRNVISFYGTTISRIMYGLSIAGATLLLGGSLTLAGVLVLTTWLGHAIAPFAPFQFMERSNDILVLSLRGLILTGASSVAVMALHSLTGGLVLLALGALMGPVYKLATLLPIIPVFNDDPNTRSTNDTAEVLFGLLTGLAMVMALLL